MRRRDNPGSPPHFVGLWGVLDKGGKFSVVTLEHGLQERLHIGVGNWTFAIDRGQFTRFSDNNKACKPPASLRGRLLVSGAGSPGELKMRCPRAQLAQMQLDSWRRSRAVRFAPKAEQ